jgi:TolA-binding protein
MLQGMGPYFAGGFSVGAGVWSMILIGRGIAWAVNTFTGRFDKREAHLDAGMKELLDQLRVQIKELQGECAELRRRVSAAETELLECKKLHAEAEARATQLEAANQGLGDARAHAQLIVSAERAATKKETK